MTLSWIRRDTVVMSCLAEVVAGPGVVPAEVDAAIGRLHELEARWSRFRPDSDVSRINAAAGHPVVVDPSTLTLLAAMTAGSVATRGAFDPSLLDVMVGFGRGPAGNVDSHAVTATVGRWFDDIEVDPLTSTVVAPAGLHLDPGGIGKGLAADLVVAELLAAGCGGALVNVGGDVRVGGRSRRDDGWRIAVGAVERDAPPVESIRLADGGVATSGTGRRPLTDIDGTPIGHVIDPTSRRPADRSIVQASVACGSAAWAEVMTKALMVDGPAAIAGDLAAMWLDADGRVTRTPAWEALR